MILLQFFAKNEEWMIDNELLVNGELKIYIGRNIVLLEKLLSTIEKLFKIYIANFFIEQKTAKPSASKIF